VQAGEPMDGWLFCRKMFLKNAEFAQYFCKSILAKI
jgi:hypothetical protein